MAWILMAAALFVLLLGVLGGVGVRADVLDRGKTAAHERTRVDAVLLTEDLTPDGGPGSESLRPARYRDAAGTEHDVAVAVVGRPPAGTVLHVWLDRQDRVASPPPDDVDALILGATAAAAVVGLGWVLLLGLWWGARRWLELRNAEQWEREWAEVEPRWTGHRR